MKNEEFNDFLKKRAEEFEIKPSSGSFDAVLQKMEQKRNRHKRFPVWGWLSAACVAGILFVVVYNNTSDSTDVVVHNQKQQNSTEQNSSTGSQSSSKEATSKEGGEANTAIAQGAPQQVAADSKGAIVNNEVKQTTATNLSVNTAGEKAETNAPANPNKSLQSETPVVVTTTDNLNNPTKEETVVVAEIPANTVTETAIASVDSVAQNNPLASADNTSGQNKKECNCTDKKWMIQAYANPFATGFYHSKQLSPESYVSQAFIPSITQSGVTSVSTHELMETPETGFEAGFKVGRKITQNWYLAAGLAYNQWSTKITEVNSNVTVDSVENYHYDAATNQFVKTTDAEYSNYQYLKQTNVNTYTSIQIPIQAQYAICKGNWGFGAHAGINFGYTTGYKQTSSVYYQNDTATVNRYPVTFSNADVNSPNSSNNTYRAFNIQLSAGVFASYRVAKNLDVYAGPRISAAMLSYNIKDNTTTKLNYPMFYGIETGIKINL